MVPELGICIINCGHVLELVNVEMLKINLSRPDLRFIDIS
jgi:hypothetical protein